MIQQDTDRNPDDENAFAWPEGEDPFARRCDLFPRRNRPIQLGLDQTHQDRSILGFVSNGAPAIAFGWRPTLCFLFVREIRPRRYRRPTTTQTYSMPVDPSNADHSAQVLEFAAQLMAASSSSKDLPSPGVVTLMGTDAGNL